MISSAAATISFSPAFRRLGGVTQVSPLAKSTLRNRLTHSQEVGMVALMIGEKTVDGLIQKNLIDPKDRSEILEICLAAGLAHDIGSLPFGHTGESTVQNWFTNHPIGKALLKTISQREVYDFTRFEGNAQTLRILKNLGLPEKVVAATIKYPCPAESSQGSTSNILINKKYNYFNLDRKYFEKVVTASGMIQITKETYNRFPWTYAVEAADDICYALSDLEDAYERGIVAYDDILNLVKPIIGKTTVFRNQNTQKKSLHSLHEATIRVLVDAAADQMITSWEDILSGNYKSEILKDFAYAKAVKSILDFSRAEIYDNPDRMDALIAGHDALVILLNSFGSAILEMIENGNDLKKTTPRTRYILKGYSLVQPGNTNAGNIHAMMDYLVTLTDQEILDLSEKMRNAPADNPVGKNTPSWNAAYHT